MSELSDCAEVYSSVIKLYNADFMFDNQMQAEDVEIW